MRVIDPYTDLLDNAPWTCFFTLTTACTFVRIDLCTEIRYCDGSIRAGLLTFLTSDTANFTCSSHCLAFRMGTAAYKDLLFIWDQLDQMPWTLCHTLPTGFTGFYFHQRSFLSSKIQSYQQCLFHI